MYLYKNLVNTFNNCRNSAENVQICRISTNMHGNDRVNNPFLNSLIVPYIEVIKSIKYVEGQPIKDSYEIESTKHIRVYTSPRTRDLLFNDLSMYARDMFLAIQYTLNEDYYYIIMSYEKMQEVYKVSEPKYGKRRYEATIRELHKYGIIDCKDRVRNQWWYNPVYLAPKSRLIMFPEYKFKIGIRNV